MLCEESGEIVLKVAVNTIKFTFGFPVEHGKAHAALNILKASSKARGN